MKKILQTVLIGLSLLTVLFASSDLTSAKSGYTSKLSYFGRHRYSTIIPKYIRGTYYAYEGKNKWETVNIGRSSLLIDDYKLTPSHGNLAFEYIDKNHKSFIFNAKAKYAAQIALGEEGMQMSHVTYKGHRMKAIKCYQNMGYRYWLVSKKVKHSFHVQD